MNLKIAFLYAVNCLIWGSSWLVIKIGLEEDLSPFLFAGLRFLIAVVFFYTFLKLQRFSLKIKKGELKHLLFLAASMIAIPYGLIFWGEQYTNSAMGAIIMCAMPLFIFPISYIMKSDEELNVTKFIGVVLGLGGVVVIFYPKLVGGISSVKGDLAIFLSMIIYSLGTVYIKKYAHDIPSRKLAFYQLLFGAPFLIIIGLIFESPALFWAELGNWKAIAALLYLGIFGSVVTFTIYYWMIKRIGAVASTSAAFVEVAVAVFLDWLIMSVIPHPYTWVGVVLIFIGVWMVMIRLSSKSFLSD